MAMLISVEEFKRLQTLAGRSEAGTRSPLPLALRRRQELLVATAQHLEARLGDPVDGLAELFSTLPPAGDDFWVEIQEII